MGLFGGKTALITGAGRGIGRAAAEAFARQKADLVLCSRTESELRSIARQAEALGARTLARICDVSNSGEVADLIREAMKAFGRIDFVINNAGLAAPRKPLVAVSDAEWNSVLGVNLSGVFFVTREALAVSMLPRRSGCIINVTSRLGKRAGPNWGPYVPSKFGVEGLTQAWACETKDLGVRFYTLDPGATRTQMRKASHPQEDAAVLKSAEVVAEAFVDLASGKFMAPSGAALDLNEDTGRLQLI